MDYKQFGECAITPIKKIGRQDSRLVQLYLFLQKERKKERKSYILFHKLKNLKINDKKTSETKKNPKQNRW